MNLPIHFGDNLVSPNRFSPLSVMVSNDEVLVLEWDESLLSVKGDEEPKSLVCEPLAQWDPNGGLVLAMEEGDFVEVNSGGQYGAFKVGENDDQKIWQVCGLPYFIL